jgi:hypothetical protein
LFLTADVLPARQCEVPVLLSGDHLSRARAVFLQYDCPLAIILASLFVDSPENICGIEPSVKAL